MKKKAKIAYKNALKSIFTFGILFIFFFQTVLIFLFFEIERFQVKYEVKANILSKLADNQLIKIIKEVNFAEHEFSQNGKMYDVVRFSVDGANKILYCYEDQKESKLNQEIESQVDNSINNHPSKKNQQKLIDFLKIKFLPTHSFEFLFCDFQEKTNNYVYLLKNYTFYLIQFSPPPSL